LIEPRSRVVHRPLCEDVLPVSPRLRHCAPFPMLRS
jgi:hypothetical protein